MLLRGDHNSAHPDLNAAALEKAIDKEVEHVWAFPLTIGSICRIKNAGVVQIGVAEQFSINKKVERYIKRRVNHDCYFLGLSGISMNNRVLRDTLQLCFYGFCLLRILQMIAAMRIKWTSKCILIVKIDLDAAYRRVHANTKIVSTCMLEVEMTKTI